MSRNLAIVLAAVIAAPAVAVDNIGALVNADFATSWTYRSGGVPSAPAGWTLGNWGATAGGPQYISTGDNCSTGRPSDHRCKYEMASSGGNTDNMLYKEVNWGTYTEATITVWAAQHSWSGGSGTQSLGVKNNGGGTSWSQRTQTANNAGTECGWGQLSLVVTKPGGATTFTVMLNGHPNGSTGWNCQFDMLAITASNPCTPPATPGAPTINGATVSSLNVTNNGGDSATAYFAIRINGGAYTNQYVQADGTVGASAVWRTKASWGTRTVTGLAASTTYTFDLKAANDSAGTCPSAFGTSAQGTTSCSAPAAPTGGWGDPNSSTQITWSWTRPAGTGNLYRVYDASGGGTLKATSTTDATSVTEGSLAVNTQYSRWVATYNVCESTTRLALPARYTWANVPSAPTVSGATSSTLNVAVNENGNPAPTVFAIKCEQGGTIRYVQANGTLGTGEAFQAKATWGTKTVTGLASGTTYTFSVAARNGDGVITAYGPTADGTTTSSGCEGESAGALVNPDFATAWTYRAGGVPSAPAGWTLGNWGASAGGPQQVTTSNDCASSRLTDHRCKYEFASSGAGTDNMLYKEVLWGGSSQATVTVYCARHSWSGGTGTASLGVKDSGCGTTWAQRTHTANNGGGECAWTQLSLTFAKPGAAPSFTIMLNGHPDGSTGWNCQFDLISVTMGGGSGTIAGNVKDGSNNNVAGATVSTNIGGYSATTDSNGNYTISNVAVGTYNVTASKAGYNPQAQTNKSVTAGATTTVNFTITLQAGNGSITGKLRDVHMTAISGATVSTTPASVSTTTAADGSFTLGNVPVNTYSVNFAKTGYQTGVWYNATVIAGQAVTLPDKLVPRSSSKIGAHVVLGRRDGWGAFLQQTHGCGKGCQLVKCLDDFGASNDMLTYSPEGLRVGRMNEWCGYDLQGMDYAVGNNPATQAQTVYNCVVTTWNANSHVEVWEIFNEWSAHWAWQADFLIAMMDIAEANGKRIALFGCSAGNPPEDAWPDIARACARAKAHGGHMLSLHEYSWTTTLQQDYINEGALLVTRYRRLYNYLRANNADCPLILTEVGNNGGGGFIGDAAFVADMGWYDDQCRQDDYVLGIASWTLGEWSGANWYTALPEMGDYICNH